MTPLFESVQASLVMPVYAHARDKSLFANFVQKASFGRIGKLSGHEALAVQSLLNISIRINPGDRVGLIGRNGAGKSSLLKVMAGILHPTDGLVRRRGEMAAVLEVGAGLDFELTGRQNLKFVGKLLQIPDQSYADFEKDIYEFCDLGAFFDLPVRTYSTGMKARLAFALATYKHSDLLLVDEFINTGDAFFVDRARERVQGLMEQSGALVLATHSPETLREFCTHAVWLDAGVIVAQGAPLDVWHKYLNDIRN